MIDDIKMYRVAYTNFLQYEKNLNMGTYFYPEYAEYAHF